VGTYTTMSSGAKVKGNADRTITSTKAIKRPVAPGRSQVVVAPGSFQL
jgi:hypothetical protein